VTYGAPTNLKSRPVRAAARAGVLATAIGVAAVIAGCGGTKVVTRTVTIAVPTSSSNTPPAGATTTSGAATTLAAGDIVAALRCLGIPIARSVTYNEQTDPNHLLDRPGGYGSKANWVDRRVKDVSGMMDVEDGGSIEVFRDPSDAKRRFDYLSTLAKQGGPLVNEYDYLLNRVVLLRVSTTLIPSQAKAYQAAAARVVASPTTAQQRCQPQASAPPRKPPKPADARASRFVNGNASPTLPAGGSNVVAVIAIGRYSDTLPVVVRNNTSQTITRIKVTGTANDPSGNLLVSGGDQGFMPDVVRPGEIALGYVYFGGKQLPSDAIFKLEATATPQAENNFDNHVDLTVTQARHVGDSIVGYLKNESPRKAMGPISVIVECFGADQQLQRDYEAFTDKDMAVPEATVPFTIDLTEASGGNDPCPVFLVAGGGFTG
jgi:hypothetical protein